MTPATDPALIELTRKSLAILAHVEWMIAQKEKVAA
jgi:hypothetical protein